MQICLTYAAVWYDFTLALQSVSGLRLPDMPNAHIPAAAVFVSFEKEFQQVTDNIAHHSTQVDWVANAANIEEAKKARGYEEATRQGITSLDIVSNGSANI
jgi:hypothetical protein